MNMREPISNLPIQSRNQDYNFFEDGGKTIS